MARWRIQCDLMFDEADEATANLTYNYLVGQASKARPVPIGERGDVEGYSVKLHRCLHDEGGACTDMISEVAWKPV